MNVLLIGSGGREHAMAWKLSQSPLLGRLYALPGNPGTASLAENVPFSPDDHRAVSELIDAKGIGMVVCGPEAPLADGLMDYLAGRHPDLALIGPGQSGARLESSKEFAKEFMLRHEIPTARYRSFGSGEVEEAIAFAHSLGLPAVIKADGLAAGKGVVIAQTHEEAESEIRAMLGGRFGKASSRLVIEEFLSGIEFSVFVLTNGDQYLLLPEAKDYKRIGEGDTGPNTGGMGSVSPVPFADALLMAKVRDRIILPTLHGLKKDEIPYRGFIFFGLIRVHGDPYVIEYNCRMGDPETESVMIRLESDLLQHCLDCHANRLDPGSVRISPAHAATICLVSGGYPGDFEKGKKIEPLPRTGPGEHIFFSGVSLREGQLVTAGGRVFAVSCLGPDQRAALDQANRLAEDVQFDGKYYRRDIGFDLQ